jgi:hypothetical protein
METAGKVQTKSHSRSRVFTKHAIQQIRSNQGKVSRKFDNQETLNGTNPENKEMQRTCLLTQKAWSSAFETLDKNETSWTLKKTESQVTEKLTKKI